MPEPWHSVLEALLGPFGGVVALALVVFFLWRLFREEQAENRKNFATVALQSKAVEALTIEVKAWREAQEGRRSGHRA